MPDPNHDPHPLVLQLRFTREEFLRGLRGVSEADARRRLGRMNCISWNVGHLAWQEQRYFLRFGLGSVPFPEWDRRFAYGAPASVPALSETLRVWKEITAAADPWLDTLTFATLLASPPGRPDRIHGNLLQRVIYHYWFHNGENQAIRQQLDGRRLPQFVGDIDERAPYRPELPAPLEP